MWILYKDFNYQHKKYFESVGRALVIAQHFEAVCLDVLKWWLLANGVEQGEIHYTDFSDFLEKFKSPLLGRGINRLDETFDISEQDYAILDSARLARNFIAHEAALKVRVPYKSSKDFSDSIFGFQEKVENLAIGDNLVSSWSYMFQEKDEPPYTIYTTYVQNTVEWVLEPVSQLKNYLK